MRPKISFPKRMVETHCKGWTFLSNFDSGNFGKVEEAVKPQGPVKNSCGSSDSIPEAYDYEFNVWTRPDCAGTEFENGNRTWFYFGMRNGTPYSLVRINIVNLNKQCKMYAQGMTPVYKTVPGKSQWERIKDKISFNMEDKQFTVSFPFRFGDTRNQTVYFAFTYPYTYSDFLNHLSFVETNLRNNYNSKECIAEPRQDDIYYHRELLIYSQESRRIDLITISSHHGITKMRETRLPNLFPDENVPRPFKFLAQKKVIFLSARVHPGETPSSFVMAGMINFLVCRDDPIAQALRRHFVFKLIPMLNPDGVFRGHYRTDTRGVNLNRVYSAPSLQLHPSIYAARAMIRYYHHGMIVPEEEYDRVVEEQISGLSLSRSQTSSLCSSDSQNLNLPDMAKGAVENDNYQYENSNKPYTHTEDSGLFLYIDMHGHTSKKGIFMYGNHFENINNKIECMLLPKLITLYSQHFLFDSCNFTEKNMYIRDKRDGSSREGCGRVAVYKATGLVRSYTLECNYNTGKTLNILPPPYREPMERKSQSNLIISPKYTPTLYEEAGKSVLSAILDLVGMHPNTRLVNSTYRSLGTVKEVLRKRLMMEELAEKDDQHERRRFSGKLSARKRLLEFMRNVVESEEKSQLVQTSLSSHVNLRGSSAFASKRRKTLLSNSADQPPEANSVSAAEDKEHKAIMTSHHLHKQPSSLSIVQYSSPDNKQMIQTIPLDEIRVTKEGRQRLLVREEGSRGGRRGTQDAPSSLVSLKPPEKKKKKKKAKEDGGSTSRRRIEKKCSAELSRRLSLDHRRKKLKPK